MKPDATVCRMLPIDKLGTRYAPATTENVVATCDYGGAIVAAVERDSLWAAQFHPEKSGAAGLQVLANFVSAVA